MQSCRTISLSFWGILVAALAHCKSNEPVALPDGNQSNRDSRRGASQSPATETSAPTTKSSTDYYNPTPTTIGSIDTRPSLPTPTTLPQNNSPNIPTSNGRGGDLGRVINGLRFQSQGQSSQYRVWAPANNSSASPAGLLVYLHGDTGSNFGPPNLDSRIDASLAAYGQSQPTLDQARAEAGSEPLWNEMVFVSILSPAHNGQFITWDTSLSQAVRNRNARFVHDLVQQMILPRYNIRLDQIFFIGQSGGAIFLSGVFVPLYGNQYRGGAIMLCGGMPPRPGIGQTPSDQFRRFFKIHFQTTFAEYATLAPDIVSGHRAYASLLARQDFATYERQGPGDHCQFPTNSQPRLLAPIIRRMAQQNQQSL